MKKIINKAFAISLLFVSIHATNVVLKSGVVVPEAKVESVLNSLKKLSKLSYWQRHEVERLYYSDHYNIFFLGRLFECSKNLELKINENEIERAHSSGFCDKDGTMDKEVAEIIKSSIKKKKFYYDIHSPVSWKTYFSKEYWKSKK